MKKANSIFSLLIFSLVITFLPACQGQEKSKNAYEKPSLNKLPFLKEVYEDAQIANFVVELFEDSKGNLWMGTMSKGVARYDGDTLVYFNWEDGLAGNTVAHVVEDRNGNLWFATHTGLSKYDGNSFKNYTKADGLIHDRVSKLLIDKTGKLWVGTWGGISLFDGRMFTEINIPKPDVQLYDYQTTMDWVTDLMEDSQGNIWITRDGYGATRFDGISFTHFTKKEGLPSNNVQTIREDNKGNIWFGSRVAEKDHPEEAKRKGEGGLSKFDGQKVIQFQDLKGLSKNDIYSMYLDRKGDLWIGANGTGIYRYDGKEFNLFSDIERKDLMPYGLGVQSMVEDKNGRLWVGVSGGLFKLNEKSIVNVQKHGPWQ